MILVHGNANGCGQWNAIDAPLWIDHFASICKSVPIKSCCMWIDLYFVFSGFLLWTKCNLLLVIAIFHGLNLIYDTCSFDVCMSVIHPLYKRLILRRCAVTLYGGMALSKTTHVSVGSVVPHPPFGCYNSLTRLVSHLVWRRCVEKH